jgi:hypothetical protein
MPVWLTEPEHATLSAACQRLLPPDGAAAAGYVDTLLGAFEFDPPRIWAGGPTSGRHGGVAGFERFHRLTPLDELAWRTRIEGSGGIAEREFNGPVVGLQQIYREGLAALGEDFATCGEDEQIRRLRAVPEFTDVLFGHACEGLYGDPVYGGNPGGIGWRAIGFAGDVQPRGWSEAEVAGP